MMFNGFNSFCKVRKFLNYCTEIKNLREFVNDGVFLALALWFTKLAVIGSFLGLAGLIWTFDVIRTAKISEKRKKEKEEKKKEKIKEERKIREKKHELINLTKNVVNKIKREKKEKYSVCWRFVAESVFFVAPSA